ncbi:HAD family hydrolase [Virgibacillus necropolis]|uniref:Hydrolase n=1 Tax=Virgibacillus necropolis TaxID=163877 RepID=A0A221MAG9_9BACI|nr:HAD family hydrolase [Virgibacillus necropolis]ASN04627.1 hydrolase [Virgibacillus necropolis]
MTYNTLFLDIDGTILRPDHTVMDSTKDAIEQVKKQGVEVFLSTGRPLHEIYDLAEELTIDSFIGYNGAFATYQNETVVDEPMDTSTIEHFLETVDQHNHEIVVYTSKKNYYSTPNSPATKAFINAFLLKENDQITPDIKNDILSMTLININDDDLALYSIDENLYLSPVNVGGINNCYDVIRKNVNKGEAIKTVLKKLNRKKEDAIAFGDGMNDKEMLETVGEGFAMGNAHPDLFAYAKNRTTTVSDSGIFNGLKQLGLVE